MMGPMARIRQLRDERDHARELAARYEEIINQQKVIIQRYWERDPSE